MVLVPREALWKVAGWFREYEAAHMAKGNLDGDVKARRNAERAEFIENMIERATPTTPAETGGQRHHPSFSDIAKCICGLPMKGHP